jgi:hypothetical protein
MRMFKTFCLECKTPLFEILYKTNTVNTKSEGKDFIKKK